MGRNSCKLHCYQRPGADGGVGIVGCGRCVAGVEEDAGDVGVDGCEWVAWTCVHGAGKVGVVGGAGVVGVPAYQHQYYFLMEYFSLENLYIGNLAIGIYEIGNFLMEYLLLGNSPAGKIYQPVESNSELEEDEMK